MIEAHFAKRPNHKILPQVTKHCTMITGKIVLQTFQFQELQGWSQLADDWKRQRDDLRRREGGRRDSHPRIPLGGRSGSPRDGGGSYPRQRERSRSPIPYSRQMSRDGRSGSPGWRESRSPPWPPRSRSSERQSPPSRRSQDRRGMQRRSPDRRSPAPRWSPPERRGSPIGKRFQSPERRGPSLERRGSSEARRQSPLGGPRLHSSPPQRSRSRERDWRRGEGWSRGGPSHTRPPPTNYPSRGGRTYNARPGPGPGRYNSQLDPRHPDRPVEHRPEEYVCRCEIQYVPNLSLRNKFSKQGSIA